MEPNCTAVFSVTELLEAILLRLDQRTLLISAQRVCKHWNHVIATSPALQRHLFFAPDWGPEVKKTAASASSCSPPPVLRPDTLTFNPLLQHAFPCLFPPADPSSPGGPWCRGPRSRPGLFRLGRLPRCSGFHLAYHDDGPGTRDGKGRVPAILDRKSDGHKAVLRRGASWRRMQVTAPPVVRVGRVGHGARPDGLDEGPGGKIVLVEEGLTMGELYDAVFEVCWEMGMPRDGKLEWWGWQHRNHAWLAWKMDRQRACACIRNGGEPLKVPVEGVVEEPTAWLQPADVVIGEWCFNARVFDFEDFNETQCKSHDEGNCLLGQWISAKAYKHEEHSSRGRLWLPNLPVGDMDSDSDGWETMEEEDEEDEEDEDEDGDEEDGTEDEDEDEYEEDDEEEGEEEEDEEEDEEEKEEEEENEDEEEEGEDDEDSEDGGRGLNPSDLEEFRATFERRLNELHDPNRERLIRRQIKKHLARSA